MKAALVQDFTRPPRLMDIDDPTARSGEALVSVRAVALTQLVRAQASGKHYSSGSLPMVPGADGVGSLPNGQRVYFAFPVQSGSMAERVAVPLSNIIELPDELDDAYAAAIANPGMSSWAALTERAAFKQGVSVLINGASGASGRLAIQIARHLGAGRIVATARDISSEAELRALGADEFIPLKSSNDDLIARFRAELHRGLDLVLDYLWGPPAQALMMAAIRHGADESSHHRVRFVNIGSMAGGSISLPANALKSCGLELMGSGIGSVSQAALIRAISRLMQAAASARFRIQFATAPFSEIEKQWDFSNGHRLVFTF